MSASRRTHLLTSVFKAFTDGGVNPSVLTHVAVNVDVTVVGLMRPHKHPYYRIVFFAHHPDGPPPAPNFHRVNIRMHAIKPFPAHCPRIFFPAFKPCTGFGLDFLGKFAEQFTELRGNDRAHGLSLKGFLQGSTFDHRGSASERRGLFAHRDHDIGPARCHLLCAIEHRQ